MNNLPNFDFRKHIIIILNVNAEFNLICECEVYSSKSIIWLNYLIECYAFGIMINLLQANLLIYLLNEGHVFVSTKFTDFI